MTDYLSALISRDSCLQPPLPPSCTVHSHIRHKNAVSAEYFSHCTRTYLPFAVGGANYSSADMVLLEMATNDWDGTRGIERLLRNLRREAPAAPLLFIGWARKPLAAVPSTITSAASSQDVEIVRIAEAISALDRERLLPKESASAPQSSYARRGRDVVHPSPIGHALMANLTAHFIADRLHAVGCDAGPRTRAHKRFARAADWESMAGRNARERENTMATEEEGGEEGLSEPLASWERCHTRLDLHDPPVAVEQPRDGGAWAVVDDGKSKGIPKLGLASWHVGNRLVLGPIRGPAGVGAAPLLVQLGYLLSPNAQTGGPPDAKATRGEANRPVYQQGAFRISCEGCTCSPLGAPSGVAWLYPFPEVQTDANSAGGHYTRLNATVTATTDFLLFWRARERCRIILTHTRSAAPRSLATSAQHPDASIPPRTYGSRIRIDSLFLRVLPRGAYQYHLVKVPSWTLRKGLADLANEPGWVFGNHTTPKTGEPKSLPLTAALSIGVGGGAGQGRRLHAEEGRRVGHRCAMKPWPSHRSVLTFQSCPQDSTAYFPTGSLDHSLVWIKRTANEVTSNPGKYLFTIGKLSRNQADALLEAMRTFLQCLDMSCLWPLLSCALSKSRSQQQQDLLLLPTLLRALGPGVPGTFVELGALDGEHLSNTFMLEKCFNWTGLLIEANPKSAEKLFASARGRSYKIHSAVCGSGPDGENGSVQFAASGPRETAHQIFDKSVVTRRQPRGADAQALESTAVPCKPLKKLMVDAGLSKGATFLSLDVEGAEELVLRTVDPAAFEFLMVETEADVSDKQTMEAVRRRIRQAGLVPATDVRGIMYNAVYRHFPRASRTA